MSSDERNSAIRAARLKAALERENLEKRKKYASELVGAINENLGTRLNVSDFGDVFGSVDVDWPADLRAAPGLVAAYVDRDRAGKIIDCISDVLGPVDGVLSFHEKVFLGGAAVSEVDVTGLLSLSERTEDSVVLSLGAPRGVMLVDCYLVGFSPEFSVLVQGDDLVEKLRTCFRSK